MNKKDPDVALNLISTIRQLSQNFLKCELDCAGMTGLVSSHGLILGCLYQHDHLPMRSIASMIGRQKSTLTVLADKLEQEGYIQREVSAEDSRIKRISLTPKGEDSRDVFMSINTKLHATLWRGFGEAEKLQAMEFFNRMEENFRTLPDCRTQADASQDENDAE